MKWSLRLKTMVKKSQTIPQMSCVFFFDQVKKNYSTLYGRSNKSQYKAVKDQAWADLVQKVNNCHE